MRICLGVSLIILLCFVQLKAQNTEAQKDSILKVLVNQLKQYNPELVCEAALVEYQSYSYLGHIINADSVMIYRIMTVQTKMKSCRGGLIKRILLFSPERCIGFYKVPDSFTLPYRTLNQKFLVFDYKIEGEPKKTKVNFMTGIPESITIDQTVLTFEKLANN